ncbi:MAG: hypothetical protein ACOX6N_03090 [Patescibacteria group bacterium]|jgi:hypothetical protein
MIRKLVIFAVMVVASTFLLMAGSVQAGDRCIYRDTQARVQKNISDPWKKEMSLNRGEYFNVGSFHNGTGQFANDTWIKVSDPGGRIFWASNGESLQTTIPGIYKVEVGTHNQTGLGCFETAWIRVMPIKSVVRDDICLYGSTQSRVQQDIFHHWDHYIKINQGGYFNVGSFHNQTGQFAHDTTIEVVGPEGERRFLKNGNRIKAERSGIYRVIVRTGGQSGSGCMDTSTVEVIPRPELKNYYESWVVPMWKNFEPSRECQWTNWGSYICDHDYNN